MQGNREYAIYITLTLVVCHWLQNYTNQLSVWHSQCCRQSTHILINKKTYMYMDKRT